VARLIFGLGDIDGKRRLRESRIMWVFTRVDMPQKTSPDGIPFLQILLGGRFCSYAVQQWRAESMVVAKILGTFLSLQFYLFLFSHGSHMSVIGLDEWKRGNPTRKTIYLPSIRPHKINFQTEIVLKKV
jgi:hypothetical protein